MTQSAMLIIKDAMVLCGLEETEDPSAEQLAHALRTLNNMVKAYSKKGLKAWKWVEVQLSLVTGQTSYSIGPTGTDLVMDYPLTIDNLRRDDNGDYPMDIISKSEYYSIVDRTQRGEPLQGFIESLQPNAKLHIWPAPDTSYVDTIKFSAKIHLGDFTSQIDTADFPPEWIEALTYNLAIRLAPKFSLDQITAAEIRATAAQMLNEAEAGDKEQGSLFLGMDNRYNWD